MATRTLNGIFAGFAFGYVVANAALVRVGVVADLFQATESRRIRVVFDFLADELSRSSR